MQGCRSAVRLFVVSLFLVFVGLVPLGARAEITITLKNSFIEKYKNRATIEAPFTVEKAHKKPNPASKDGDLHVAGRAAEVGLPIVAEIMNAASVPQAVARIHDLEGSGEKVSMAGAWRIWTEHGGDSEQIQGKKIPPYKNANPDHVFEIHPVTRIGDISVADTLRPIEGFKPKQAQPAFHRYEITKSQIIAGKTTTTLVTNMAGTTTSSSCWNSTRTRARSRMATLRSPTCTRWTTANLWSGIAAWCSLKGQPRPRR